jgi:hypothetical protein
LLHGCGDHPHDAQDLTRSVAALLAGVDAGGRDRSDGGPTSYENLALPCWTHRHCKHDGNLTIEGAGPKRVFRSSVGQEYPVGGT